MRRFGVVTTIGALLLTAGVERAGAVQRLIDVRQIATDTLHDVALATFEHGSPVIYYNPRLLQQFGPELTAFFLAHEFGHIRYGHTGAALVAGEGDVSAVRQRQELEADCYAASTLGDSDPAATTAALRFFARMGPFRFDSWHPSGAQRAAKILACLPTESSDRANSSDVPVVGIGAEAVAPNGPPT
ncbi:MAG: hypothetical protein ABIQ49_06955 [Gemmatimonadales bacterium]